MNTGKVFVVRSMGGRLIILILMVEMNYLICALYNGRITPVDRMDV